MGRVRGRPARGDPCTGCRSMMTVCDVERVHRIQQIADAGNLRLLGDRPEFMQRAADPVSNGVRRSGRDLF